MDSPKSVSENARRVVYEFAENVITIFWCLSETSNKALNAINSINLIPFLMSFLAARDKLPTATVTAAAQSLYVLTDDNRPAIHAILSNTEYISCLLDVVRSNQDAPIEESNGEGTDRFVMLTVLSCGILGNLSPLPPGVAPSLDVNKDLVFPLLQPVISSVALDDTARQVQELVARQESEPPEIEKLSLKHAPKSDHKSPTELELERLETRLRTVQLALEMLTGTCATLPDPVTEIADGEDDQEEMEDESEHVDDAVMEDDMAAEGDTIQALTDPSSPSSLPALVQPLLMLIQPTSMSFPPPSGLSCHPPTTSALSAIHIIVAADESAGQIVWSKIWESLSRVGLDIALGQERKREIWEIAVGVLWGVGKVWKGKLVPDEEQVRVLTSMCDSSMDPQVQVRCIGALECLAQHPHSIDANRVIASYLLKFVPSSTASLPASTEPLIQAVSALIDIYSDERLPYDINFRNGKFEESPCDSSKSVYGSGLPVELWFHAASLNCLIFTFLMSDEFDGYDFSEFTPDDFAAIDAAVSRMLGPASQIAVAATPLAGPALQVELETAIAHASSSEQQNNIANASFNCFTSQSTSEVVDSPYKRFISKKKAFSVTDLVSPVWCELQYEYGLYGEKYKPLAQRPTLFTLAQLIMGFNEIVIEYQRELPVFGIIHGHAVLGVIDEVVQVSITSKCSGPDPHADERKAPQPGSPVRKRQRTETPSPTEAPSQMAPPSIFMSGNEDSKVVIDNCLQPSQDPYALRLLDYKTRRAEYLPPVEDILSSKLQLMLYHRMLASLLDPETIDFELLWRLTGLDPGRPFSARFIRELGWENNVSEDQLRMDLHYLVAEWVSTVHTEKVEKGCLQGISEELQLIYRRPIDPTNNIKQQNGGEHIEMNDPLQVLVLQEEPELTRAMAESLRSFSGEGEAVSNIARAIAWRIRVPYSLERLPSTWLQVVNAGSVEEDAELSWAIQESLLSLADTARKGLSRLHVRHPRTADDYLHFTLLGEHILFGSLRLDSFGSLLLSSILAVAICLIERLYMLLAMSYHVGIIAVVVISLTVGQFFIEYHNHPDADSERYVQEPLLGAPVRNRKIRTKSKPDAIFIHPYESNLARADAAALELGIAGDAEYVQGNIPLDDHTWEHGRGKDIARELFRGNQTAPE
ncbi:hypothetical protein ID866_3997 [Astraeus odoratus]|nr:hypothetical protein ID866_3997 [Astraeus odoratus]